MVLMVSRHLKLANHYSIYLYLTPLRTSLIGVAMAEDSPCFPVLAFPRCVICYLSFQYSLTVSSLHNGLPLVFCPSTSLMYTLNKLIIILYQATSVYHAIPIQSFHIVIPSTSIMYTLSLNKLILIQLSIYLSI